MAPMENKPDEPERPNAPRVIEAEIPMFFKVKRLLN